jgi:hypothetical protein
MRSLYEKRKAELSQPPPPNGTNGPGPARPPNDAATGGAAEATASEGARAFADWRMRACAAKNEFEIAAAYLKREREFDRLGVKREALQYAIDLIKPLMGTDSDNECVAFVRAQARQKRAA